MGKGNLLSRLDRTVPHKPPYPNKIFKGPTHPILFLWKKVIENARKKNIKNFQSKENKRWMNHEIKDVKETEYFIQVEAQSLQWY